MYLYFIFRGCDVVWFLVFIKYYGVFISFNNVEVGKFLVLSVDYYIFFLVCFCFGYIKMWIKIKMDFVVFFYNNMLYVGLKRIVVFWVIRGFNNIRMFCDLINLMLIFF